MITLSAKSSDLTFGKWRKVDDVIRKHLIKRNNWFGYVSRSFPADVLEELGMSRVYRGSDNYVRYEFTEEQYTLFLLRWG